MFRFLLKNLIFLLLFTSIIFAVTKVLSLKNEKKKIANYNTDENLFTINRNEQFDFLIMGISHARVFTTSKNHLRVEKILNKKFANISRGGGKCGPPLEYAYLKHFFGRGNKANKVIIIPSPPMFFSNTLNMNTSSIENEPFRIDFFFQFLFSSSENKNLQLYYYLRNKYTPQWSKKEYGSLDSVGWSLEKYDTTVIKNGFKQAYPDGLDQSTFKRNKIIIRDIVELCRENDADVIFMMTPSVFGSWPGSEQVFSFLHELKSDYGVKVYDFSDVCKDPSFYYDHHHLNTKGVVWFTQNYLKQVLD